MTQCEHAHTWAPNEVTHEKMFGQARLGGEQLVKALYVRQG